MEEAFPIKNSRYLDKRGKSYIAHMLARDVQTGDKMVIYEQEYGDREVLCCPLDAFRISMIPAEDAGEDPIKDLSKKPKNGQEKMIAFLDTDDFEEKSNLLKDMYLHGEVTNSIIDNLAAALDVVIEEGDIQSRYEQLRICVDTRARYESLRLR